MASPPLMLSDKEDQATHSHNNRRMTLRSAVAARRGVDALPRCAAASRDSKPQNGDENGAVAVASAAPTERSPLQQDVNILNAVDSHEAPVIKKRSLIKKSTTRPVKRRKRWTEEEDAKLVLAVNKYRHSNPGKKIDWLRLASTVFEGTRSPFQCMKHYRDCHLKRGPDSAEDDALDSCDLSNEEVRTNEDDDREWEEVREWIMAEVESSEPIAHLKSSEKESKRKNKWTDQEFAILLHAQAEIGNQWVKISELLPNKSNIDCRNRWYTCQLKLKGSANTENGTRKLEEEVRKTIMTKVESSGPNAHLNDFLSGATKYNEKWTDRELAILFHAQAELGNQWQMISELLPYKSSIDCSTLWFNYQSKLKRVAKKESSTRKLKGTQKASKKRKIARLAKNEEARKLGEDVRELIMSKVESFEPVADSIDYQRVPNRNGKWTDRELAILFHAQAELGNQWQKISELLPNKTSNDCSSLWHNYQAKLRHVSKKEDDARELKGAQKSTVAKAGRPKQTQPMVDISESFAQTLSPENNGLFDQSASPVYSIEALEHFAPTFDHDESLEQYVPSLELDESLEQFLPSLDLDDWLEQIARLLDLNESLERNASSFDDSFE